MIFLDSHCLIMVIQCARIKMNVGTSSLIKLCALKVTLKNLDPLISQKNHIVRLLETFSYNINA